jgi:hypothetical protein
MFPDFVAFVGSLNEHRVRFLVVGGYAVAFHARPRATKDVHVLVDPTVANAKRLLRALADFLGAPPKEITLEKLTSLRTVLVLGRSPVRIDVLTSLEGLSFRSAWQRSVEGPFGSARSRYISLDDLILVKSIAGRPQDVADVAVLRAVKRLRLRTRKK